jgi:phenylacetate-coenzyme A ligase PaaK-like adenylate-forming protein
MVAQGILADTACLYRSRSSGDERYAVARDVLEGAMREFGFAMMNGTSSVSNSKQFIVLKTSGTTGEPKLLRHPMDFHDSVIEQGIRALDRNGMLDVPRTCVIAISRGRLSGSFLFVYEVARRCEWSILLLGASDDRQDIADLCTKYSVDTVFMQPNNIGATFTADMIGRFDSVANLLYMGDVPSTTLSERLLTNFPHITLRPFIYSSNETGPLGIPTSGGSGNTYDVPDNVLLEVEDDRGIITLNGSGQILASVLGLEDPRLIRWRIGDVGKLTTDADARQLIEIHGRGEISVKFHPDSVGRSVILQKSVVTAFLRHCNLPDHIDTILNIRNSDNRTVIDVNIISDENVDEGRLSERFNDEFPVLQLRGRFSIVKISEDDAKKISPGKRRFFIKSY